MGIYNYRFADVNDAEGILNIYSYYVENTVVSFEYTTPSVSEFKQRIADITSAYPFLVCETCGVIAGYSYASQYKERAAYRYDAATSIYVSESHQGCGIGRELYTRLFDILKDAGYYNAYAGIALPNEKSVLLHKSFGFSEIAAMRNTGYKLGRWIDVLLMEKNITDYSVPPAEGTPLSPAAWRYK